MKLPRVLLATLVCSSSVAAAGSPAEDLAAKARQGREALAAGRFDQAASLYAEIVQALPDQPGMRLNLGMALSMAGRPAEAIEHLAEAVELQPDLLPAWLFLGTAYLELDQPEQAVPPLRRVLEQQPGDLDVRQRLAHALLSVGRHDEAAQQYRIIAERAPERPEAWYGLVRSNESLRESSLEELERTAPGSPELSLLVADMLEGAGRDIEALRLYQEGLEKRPGLPEIHEALARIYDRREHPEWAEVERDKAKALAALDCDTPGPSCDYQAGRYDAVIAAARSLETAEARYWLSRAAGALARHASARLDELPPSPEAVLLRTDLRRARREPAAESIEELKRAVETWPDDERLRRELADGLLAINDADGARTILEELLAGAPDSAGLALQLGECWLKLQRPDKAIPFLERAAERDADLIQARAALGRAYMEIDEPTKAAAALETALEADTDGSLYFQLARAYRAMGEDDRADRAMQEFEERRARAEGAQGSGDAHGGDGHGSEGEHTVSPPQTPVPPGRSSEPREEGAR